jgi:preprotein translocase subunit SecE
VARDRKRAKQRRQRGAAAGRRAPSADPAANSAQATSSAPGADEHASAGASALERADLPAALDHASSDVDEFDAAIIRGAGGVPVVPDSPTDTDTDDDFDYDTEDALQEPAGPSRPGGGSGPGGAGGGRSGDGGEVARPSGAPLRGGNRAIGFLRASWAELQRVQWPDRRHVFQATAVVLGFVAIAGLYLGAADTVAKEIVEFIL